MKYIYLAIFAGNMLIGNAHAVDITYTIGTQAYSQVVEFSSIEHKNSPVLSDALKSIVIGAYNKNGATDEFRAAMFQIQGSDSLLEILLIAKSMKLAMTVSAAERFNMLEADKMALAALARKRVITISGAGKNLLEQEMPATWADIAGAYATEVMYVAGNVAYDAAAVVGSYALESGKHYGKAALSTSYEYSKAGAVAVANYALESGKHYGGIALNASYEYGKAGVVAAAGYAKTGAVAFGSWAWSSISSYAGFGAKTNTASSETPTVKTSTSTQSRSVSLSTRSCPAFFSLR